ncbi:MAG TPA: hypothetical protein VEF04_23490 [Blastocatellia bacterium]|nr:hypothetical protein [Blastocatellia bacterium]
MKTAPLLDIPNIKNKRTGIVPKRAQPVKPSLDCLQLSQDRRKAI